MRRHSWAAMLLGLCACTASEIAPNADFAAPAGMALAGKQFQYAFVANTGAAALQVVRIGNELADLDLVAAPAHFQPLYIPVGASPTAVAASFDGAYVFALDAATSTLRALDAEALRVLRAADGNPLQLPLPEDGVPTSLVALPGPCQSTVPGARCLGRVFLSLRDAASVLAVDLLQDAAGAWQLQTAQTLPTGGAPQRLAMHPRGSCLFASDALAAEVIRLDLQAAGLQPGGPGAPGAGGAAAASRFSFAEAGDVDPATGDALAVAADGSLVAVGRARWRDVVLLAPSSGQDAAVGPLQPLPVDSTLAPAPGCLSACGAPAADACAGAHPADRALCVTPPDAAAPGYGATQPYRAVYVGMVPAQIVALTDGAGGALPLSTGSAAAGAAPPGFRQSFAVAGLDGSIALLGTHTLEGTLAPRYVVSSDAAAYLSYPADEIRVPEAYLAECPTHPLLSRFACLGAGTAAPTRQVLWQRGRTPPPTFSLAWEGILPQAEQRVGTLQEDGSFVDPQGAAMLGGAGLLTRAAAAQAPIGGQPYGGDLLQLLPMSGSLRCADPTACHTERTLVAVQQNGEALRYAVDPPFDASCFANRQMAYQVRVGRAYLTRNLGAEPAVRPQRLPLGATYGLLDAAQAAQGATFTAKVLPVTPRSGCETYADNGDPDLATAEHDALLSRRLPLIFAIQDAYGAPSGSAPLTAGAGGNGGLGYVPGGMLMTRQDRPTLLISFTGSDNVLAVDPTQAIYGTPLDNRHAKILGLGD